ncbi:sirohydrochlorin chelatase [Gracilibacillus kekensis]|uniref:Sirohydrochlorin ferrochelatase n=1 Tax=Gracilibacillus kekensis TaxID=1027249 RepID=A0A1M7MIG3_9BACI|nr:sirohydrochlorin chelatase [Gracilibacillus kekensis]SHM90251.1 sirohydrochlorin ferrochelatase [Gracilibacillus kekensis]
MEAVIYICHGSRLQKAKIESYALIDKVKKGVDIPLQETCFLELQEPTLSETVHKVIEKGATNVIIMPILLLTAGHAKKDIPNIIDKEKDKYPDVDFIYGRAIEVDYKMVEILIDRISTCTSEVEEYDLLLVGRGSSDRSAVEDTERIVHLLKEYYPNNKIEKCFLAASEPKFEALLLEKVKDNKSVLILPYLLFTGLLDKGIKEFIEQFELQKDQKLLLADYLGHHPNVTEVLISRVAEARKEANSDAAMVKRSS